MVYSVNSNLPRMDMYVAVNRGGGATATYLRLPKVTWGYTQGYI